MVDRPVSPASWECKRMTLTRRHAIAAVTAASYSRIMGANDRIGIGFVGYGLRKLDCEPAPLMLGFVLGPMIEENFRRAMVLSKGEFSVFITRPISAILLAVTAVLIIAVALPAIRNKREAAFQED